MDIEEVVLKQCYPGSDDCNPKKQGCRIEMLVNTETAGVVADSGYCWRDCCQKDDAGLSSLSGDL